MIKRNLLAVLGIAASIVLGLSVAHGQQGRYVNTYNRTQVNGFVQQLEASSDAFHTDFRREVNNSGLSVSTKRTYMSYALQFENAIDRLRNRFNSNDSWWESRNEVRNMVANSQNLNTTMNVDRFRRNLERQWNRLRNDINRLADTYDLPGLSGGGWTGGGIGGGVGGGAGIPAGGGTRPPAWAQGTFYGTAPTGAQIMLTINRNGQVTANIGGSVSYGTYSRGTLTMGYNTARVNRLGDGFQTVSTLNGETINYTRNAWGGEGPIGGGPIGGPIGGGNPPNWAVGSFVGTNPINGTNIFMTVGSDGGVTVTMGGSQSYGRMDGSYLTMGSSTARVHRENNGFRTVSTGDGQTIYYRRN